MASSSNGHERLEATSRITAAFEKCLAEQRRVDVTFVSRRTGEVVSRRCIPVAPESAAPSLADPRLFHFREVNERLGTTHPLALMPERIMRIEPSDE